MIGIFFNRKRCFRLLIRFYSAAAVLLLVGLQKSNGLTSVNIPTNNQNPLFHQMVNSEGVSVQTLQETSFEEIRLAIGKECQVVLIGEASHGTEEFYRIRADLTKSLLKNNDGFDAILCEGDWKAFWDLNQFVQSTGVSGNDNSCSFEESMAGFQDRFPTWLWQNDAMEEFATWLKEFNQNNALPKNKKPVHLLGLDIHGMFQSTDQVVNNLMEVDEIELAELARCSYATLNNFRPDLEGYSRASYGGNNAVPSQDDNVAQVIQAVSEKVDKLLQNHQIDARKEELLFDALENAHVVAASEAFYRQYYFPGHPVPWNIRDSAFMDRIQRVILYLKQQKQHQQNECPVRVIVWAHNWHIGDATATGYFQMQGQNSVGQLCRQVFGKDNVYIVGFTTHHGTVLAAPSKEPSEPKAMELKPARKDSHESLLHAVAQVRRQNEFGFTLRSNTNRENGPHEQQQVDMAARELLGADALERFVGSSYLPAEEFQAHYSTCNMSEQFDFVIHVDQSTALVVK